jgi:hypothetical protein
LQLKGIGAVEINEAFTAQTIACQRELDLEFSMLKVVLLLWVTSLELPAHTLPPIWFMNWGN